MPTGTCGWRARKAAIIARQSPVRTPASSAACGRAGDHRAVGDRVGKGDAELDHVGPALDQGVEQSGGRPRARDGRASGTRRTRSRRAVGSARTSRHSGSSAASEQAVCDLAPCPCRRAPTGRPRSAHPARPPRARSAWATAWALSSARDDALVPRQRLERGERRLVGRADIGRRGRCPSDAHARARPRDNRARPRSTSCR